MERVYLYTPNAEKKGKVQELCGRLGMECRELMPGDLNRYVAEIVEAGTAVKRPVHPENAPAFYRMPELQLFFGLADGRLDEYLEEYRKAGIDPISYKAVITPFNRNWTLYELALELKRENDQMNR
jgi:hypothetical protein